MLTERLQARCPSASPVGPARATGFAVAIAKKSADRSGKATLTPASREMPQETFGVLFEIHMGERASLDHAEGPGYERDDAFAVALMQCGRRYEASTYIARDTHVAQGLHAFCWYRALIIAGAEQHGLPRYHVARLHAAPFRPDPNLQRTSHKEAINVLESAGFKHLLP